MLKKYFSIVANPIRLHLMLWGLYFTFVWAHQLNHTPRGLTAGSIASWADGALHLSLISYFSYTTLTPDNLPVYYHHPLAYPFLVNWLTALLVRLGLPLITSYTFMGLILSLLFIYLLYRFYFYFQPQPLTALISSTIFLCSGGLGFIWFLQNLIFPPLTTPSTLLESEYTNMAAQHIGWINVVTSEFLPQRAFLLGISFGLLLLIFSYRTLAIKQSLPYKTYFFFGLAYGLLPIIHPHTMIALSPLIITICFSMLKRRQLTQLVIFCLTILSISLPLIHLFVLSGSGISQIRFYPGWLAKSYSVNWLWFWFLNWGIFPLVSLLGLKYLNTFQKIFIFPFTLVFIAANLFLFQAYDWDNSKLLTWVYLVFSAPAGLLITKLFSQPTPRQIIGLILFITTIFSGSLDIIRVTNYSRRSIPMLSTEEINLSNWINQHTPTESIGLLPPIITIPFRFSPAAKSSWVIRVGYGVMALTIPLPNQEYNRYSKAPQKLPIGLIIFPSIMSLLVLTKPVNFNPIWTSFPPPVGWITNHPNILSITSQQISNPSASPLFGQVSFIPSSISNSSTTL